ncbi:MULTISPECIES: hypothetical protein [unclassified Corynebacterium]|uniref:hypothetical protein n=1 Tax=unclassified Corynebacterium TaxID=2624378 RepID=UPI00114CC687|nr:MULTISPECIES: hypothetical protein [unclassified Corynebacterium]MDK7134007.1 hypothetical protein [Corynebacterium sp. UMB4614]
MLNGNFHLAQFLWVIFILVLIPTVVVYILINRHVPENCHNSRLPRRAPVASFLVGLLSAAFWLSWSPRSSIGDFFLYGAPNQFPKWQIIGCGISLILGSGIIAYVNSGSVRGTLIISLLTGSGFGAAFAFDASFGVTSQEGIGVVFAFVGVALLCIPLNLLFVAIKRIVNRKNSPK